MSYYGIFSELIRLGPEEVEVIGLYEGYFAQNYERILGTYDKEVDYYIKSACIVDGKILELACGTGRILMKLAKMRFKVKGIELSEAMLDELEKKLELLRPNIRKNIEYEKADIWDFTTDEKYGLIILPATTICYFVNDISKTVELFKKIYDMLEDGGRFVFDYRADQDTVLKKAGSLGIQFKDGKNGKEFILYQEFDNYVSGYSIVNFYAEKIENHQTKRYMTSSSKKIVTNKTINRIIEQTDFLLVDQEQVELNDGIKINYLTLQKGEN